MPKINNWQLQKKTKKQLTALGVHIFAGGFTCGVKQAGFRVLAHLEDSPYGVSTVHLNWPNLDVRIGEKNWNTADFTGQVDFLYSNPPCAIFSTAGISTTQGADAWRNDPRLECWHRAFSVFETVRPKVFALESVCQAYTKGREVIDNFTQRARAAGYLVTHLLMDAKWTGLPQSRKRFFFVAYLPELDFQPSFDFADPPTVGEVLATVQDPGFIRETRWTTDKACKKVLVATKQGGKLRTTFDRLNPGLEPDERGKIKGRPGFLGARLNASSQMGVFIGDVYFHPTEDRSLGVNEMKAVCGYPDWFQLDGSPTGMPGLIARAVLPPVGNWLAKQVKRAINGRDSSSLPSVSLIDIRKPGSQPVEVVDKPKSLAVHSQIVRKLRIAFTGFTRSQAFPRDAKSLRRTIQKIDVPAAIAAEMTRQGQSVDWSVCDLADYRDDFDGLVLMVAGCTSIHAVGYAAQGLWSLYQAKQASKPCILFYDDWNLRQTQNQFRSFYRGFETSIKKRYMQYAKCDYSDFVKLKLELTAMADLVSGKSWPDEWTALCPMYSGWGDRKRAFSAIPTDRFLTVDATPAVIDLDWQQKAEPAVRGWKLASLGDHRDWVGLLGLGWPVSYAGHRKCGDRLASEADVMQEVGRHLGSLSPPYPQAGSGWFRARYVYSALAGRAIYPDPAEADTMGEAYQFDPREFEGLGSKRQQQLARQQREWLLGGDGRVNLRQEQFEAEVATIIAALQGDQPPRIKKTEIVIAAKQPKTIRKAVIQITKKKKKRQSTIVSNSLSRLPLPGEGSGQFIRRLWMTGDYVTVEDVDKLVSLVHENWSDFSMAANRECRTKRSDVRWNWDKLINDGVKGVPDFPRTVTTGLPVQRGGG